MTAPKTAQVDSPVFQSSGPPALSQLLLGQLAASQSPATDPKGIYLKGTAQPQASQQPSAPAASPASNSTLGLGSSAKWMGGGALALGGAALLSKVVNDILNRRAQQKSSMQPRVTVPLGGEGTTQLNMPIPDKDIPKYLHRGVSRDVRHQLRDEVSETKAKEDKRPMKKTTEKKSDLIITIESSSPVDTKFSSKKMSMELGKALDEAYGPAKTVKEAFKLGFAAKLSELGLLPSDIEKAAAEGGGSSAGTAARLRYPYGALAFDVANKGIEAGTGLMTVVPTVAGAATGYGVANAEQDMQDMGNLSIQDLKQIELLHAYQRGAAELRRRKGIKPSAQLPVNTNVVRA